MVSKEMHEIFYLLLKNVLFIKTNIHRHMFVWTLEAVSHYLFCESISWKTAGIRYIILLAR